MKDRSRESHIILTLSDKRANNTFLSTSRHPNKMKAQRYDPFSWPIAEHACVLRDRGCDRAKSGCSLRARREPRISHSWIGVGGKTQSMSMIYRVSFAIEWQNIPHYMRSLIYCNPIFTVLEEDKQQWPNLVMRRLHLHLWWIRRQLNGNWWGVHSLIWCQMAKKPNLGRC